MNAHNKRKCFGSGEEINLYEDLKYGKFVLYLHGGRSCMQLSAQRSNTVYQEKETINDKNKHK